MENKLDKATFAAGCFWGVEELFRKVPGVKKTTVGYTGGDFENPTYEDVCSGTTGHAEAVEIEYDPRTVTYKQLLEIFFENHDPTTENAQGPDIGEQYRSAIFYHTREQKETAEKYQTQLENEKKFPHPIVTAILPAQPFYRAEEYHQRYLEKRGSGSCHV